MNPDERLKELGNRVSLSEEEITIIKKKPWYWRNPRIYFIITGVIAVLSYIFFTIGMNKHSPVVSSDLTSVTTPITSSDLTSVTTPITSSDLTSVTTTTTSSDLTSVTTTDNSIYPYGTLLGSLMVISSKDNKAFFKIFRIALLIILVGIFGIVIGFTIGGSRSPLQDTIAVINGKAYANAPLYGVYAHLFLH